MDLAIFLRNCSSEKGKDSVKIKISKRTHTAQTDGGVDAQGISETKVARLPPLSFDHCFMHCSAKMLEKDSYSLIAPAQ